MADSTIIYSGTKVSQLSTYPGNVLNPDDLFLISKKDDDGKYTSYKIDYRNMLTAVATNSFLSNAYYDLSSKKLVLNFIVNDNLLCSVSCTIGDMIQPYTAGSYIKIQNNKISALIQGGRLISVKKGNGDENCWINSTLSAGRYTDFSGDKVNANIIAGGGVWLSNVNNSCLINVNYGSISSVLNLSSYGSKLSAGDYIKIQNNKISALLSAGNGIKLSKQNNYCKIEVDMSKISSDLKLSSYAKPYTAGDYIKIQSNKISALVKAGKGIKVSKTSSNECLIENALSGGTYSEINNNKINVRMLAGSGIAINNVSNLCKINAKYNEISSGIHLSNYALTSLLSTILKLSAGTYINTNGNKINVQLSAGNGIKLISTPANYCKIEADMSKISSALNLSNLLNLSVGDYVKILNNKISALVKAGKGIKVSKTSSNECLIENALSGGKFTNIQNNKINANISASSGIKIFEKDNTCYICADYNLISANLHLSDYSKPYYPGRAIKIANNNISNMVFAGKGLKEDNRYFGSTVSACYFDLDYNIISSELKLSSILNLSAGKYIKINDNKIDSLLSAGNGIKLISTPENYCKIEADMSKISSDLKLSSYAKPLSAGDYVKIQNNKISALIKAGNGIKVSKTLSNECLIEADMSKISSVLNLSNLLNLSAGDYVKIQNNKISALIKAGNGIKVSKTLSNECLIEADFSKLSSLLSVDYLLSSLLSSGTYIEVDNVNHRVNSLLTAGYCIVIKEDGDKFSINADCLEIASEINLSDYAHLSDLEHVDVLSSKGGRYTTVNLNRKTYTIDVDLSAVSADLNLSAYTTIVHEGSYISIDNKNNISALIKGSDNIKVSKDTDKFCKIEVDLPHLSSDLSLDIYATPYFAGTYISVDSSKNIVHNTLREGRGIKIKQGSGSQSGIYKITTDIEAITADIALSNYVLISTLHRLSAGLSCLPVGNYTWVEGFKTSAYGDFGHSEGLCTNAYGDGLRLNGAYMRSYLGNKLNFAHAEGSNTLAYSVGSHAEGEGTSACAAFSHTEGLKCTTLYLNEGGLKYVAEYSHTEGLETSCAGRFSHAEGDKNYVKGYGAHVEGVSSEVYGNYAHAEGRGNITHGDGSHVEGDYNTSNGDYSHVEGQRNIIFGKTNNTNGHYSHAEGQENKVYGSYSHAEGHYNAISSDYSHAEGVSCVIPLSDDHTFCFNGNSNCSYKSNGPGTFNINVEDGLNNVYIGTSSLYELIVDVVKRYGPVTL